MTSPEIQIIDVSVKETPINRKPSIERERRKTKAMENKRYFFELRNLSEEPCIRQRQLRDLQAKYAQEAREKVYHEIKIQKNRGISFDEYVAAFGLDNYYTLCRLELENYLRTGKEYTARKKVDHLLSYSGFSINQGFVDTEPRARPSIGHVLSQPPSPEILNSEKPTLSFEALMLGNFPGVTIQEAIRAPFESSSIPVSDIVTYTPTKVEARVLDDGSQLAAYRAYDDRENSVTALGTKFSMVIQSSAAGDQKGTIRVKITDKAADVKQSAIFDPILATGDNSVTAPKVTKKTSVAARIGKWLRRFFFCTKKSQLKD